MRNAIRNATVITLNNERIVFDRATIVIEEGRIAYVGPKSQKSKGLTRLIDGEGLIVVPSFIHAHLHACQTLFRGAADNLQLLDWLRKRVWPLEAAHTQKTMRASADLTFAELIKSGATTALDMGSVHHYDTVFESAQECGIRLVGGKAMMDAGDHVPNALKETTDFSINESLRLLKKWHMAADNRLRYAFAPRFALSCSKELLEQVAALSRSHNVRIHTHASENKSEIEAVVSQTGHSNIEYFESLRLLGEHLIIAHGIWLSPRETELIQKAQAHVCHCPSSNLKLASGVAHAPEMLRQGINVALGADGAACNNNLDMFTEMRLAALMHLPRVGADGFSAEAVLEMATRNGAQALGLLNDVGSIEVGKKADLTFIEKNQLHTSPSPHNIVAHVVYAAQSKDVVHVMCDGRWLMRDRKLLTLDEATVLANAHKAALQLVNATRLESGIL